MLLPLLADDEVDLIQQALGLNALVSDPGLKLEIRYVGAIRDFIERGMNDREFIARQLDGCSGSVEFIYDHLPDATPP